MILLIKMNTTFLPLIISENTPLETMIISMMLELIIYGLKLYLNHLQQN